MVALLLGRGTLFGGVARGLARTRCLATAASPEAMRQLLGVGEDASRGEIKRAFRLRAMELHPDVVRAAAREAPSADAAERLLARSNVEFVALVESYEALLALERAPRGARGAGPRRDKSQERER